jgi:hypothetical protein
MKTMLRFLRRVASSRLGQLLFVVHLIIVVSEFAHKPSATYSDTPCVMEPSSAAFIAGRSYHWAYESSLLKVVNILDFPALVIGGIVSKMLSPLNLCAFTRSWVDAVLALTFASVQWLLVGLIIEFIFRGLKNWGAGAPNRRAT